MYSRSMYHGTYMHYSKLYISGIQVAIAIMERKSRRRDGGHIAWYGIHIKYNIGRPYKLFSFIPT